MEICLFKLVPVLKDRSTTELLPSILMSMKRFDFVGFFFSFEFGKHENKEENEFKAKRYKQRSLQLSYSFLKVK